MLHEQARHAVVTEAHSTQLEVILFLDTSSQVRVTHCRSCCYPSELGHVEVVRVSVEMNGEGLGLAHKIVFKTQDVDDEQE